MRHTHNIKHLQHTSHGVVLALCCVSMSRHGVQCHAVVAEGGGAGELTGRGLSEAGVAGGARAAVGVRGAATDFTQGTWWWGLEGL